MIRKFLLLIVLMLVPCACLSESLSDILDRAEDKPAAFGHWFLSHDWDRQQLRAWEVVFDSITDDRDRSLQATHPIESTVHIAIVSGTVYHPDGECSSLRNAHTIVIMDEKEAQERGFRICKSCRD